MTKSMTGFGLSKSISKQSDAYVEIKGVNHKFLDISLKSNDLNNELEEYIRNSVSKKIVRGRVEIKVKFNAESKISYSINSNLLKKFEKSLRKHIKFSDALQFRDIKDVPGIFNSEVVYKVNYNLIKKVFNKAMDEFVQSRIEEGIKIKKVILKKVKRIESINSKISNINNKNFKKRTELYKEKVMLITSSIDESRMEQEVAVLALKHDVREEIDRINFHTDLLKKELEKKACSGKKIDFILQELFREANTLSVKLDDPHLKNHALDVKLLIEEMREQAQNVE
tara:strand:- start:660 stop:1508 length:849 start_codon:yes stop_codon:yes gene_type:complete